MSVEEEGAVGTVEVMGCSSMRLKTLFVKKEYVNTAFGTPAMHILSLVRVALRTGSKFRRTGRAYFVMEFGEIWRERS